MYRKLPIALVIPFYKFMTFFIMPKVPRVGSIPH